MLYATHLSAPAWMRPSMPSYISRMSGRPGPEEPPGPCFRGANQLWNVVKSQFLTEAGSTEAPPFGRVAWTCPDCVVQLNAALRRKPELLPPSSRERIYSTNLELILVEMVDCLAMRSFLTHSLRISVHATSTRFVQF